MKIPRLPGSPCCFQTTAVNVRSQTIDIVKVNGTSHNKGDSPLNRGQGASILKSGLVQSQSEDVEGRTRELRRVLRTMDSVLVAFSGGCDSTFLLKMAALELGDRAAALTAASATHPARELAEARSLASAMGVRHLVVESRELDDPGFAGNSERRCYVCKKELFGLCLDQARKLGLAFVADASNVDDLNDYRPGREAAAELGIRSPLVEAGFTKQDIREASRRLGLATWDKPAFACLASRFPYGTAITAERLAAVGACEDFLRGLGFRVLRVRYHGDVARIELAAEEMDRCLDADLRSRILEQFRKEGFAYVTLDLQGYRSGSMNEVLDPPGRR
jgi:uncharacterized protein